MKIKNLLFSGIALFGLSISAKAQTCATTVANGSSSNAFTNVITSTNALAADKELNTIVFVHRNNAPTLSGTPSQIRYDISTNGGNTWNNDLGFLNTGVTVSLARYPQVGIYNPTGNTAPANAYLAYHAPTINASGGWDGHVTGVRKLDNTGNTEHHNQAANNQTFVPRSMCKGAPGVFWTIDLITNGTVSTGFRVYKGVWNGPSDIAWSTNHTILPSFRNGIAQIGDFHISFDPTGQYGWICVLTHLNGGPSPLAYYPVFYKTTDGGTTWSDAIQIDLAQFSCITSNITAGNFPTTAFEADLTVDINGEPHLFTTIGNSANNYSYYTNQWHQLFDITYHFGLWNAINVSDLKGGRAFWGTGANQTFMDATPMVARSADGTKVFFSWTDNAGYAFGAMNNLPNLFSKAFDVTTQKWTAVKDFTSCNTTTNGKILFPKLADEVLEPANGQYKMAALYTKLTAGDPGQPAFFNFLNNLIWNNSDFTTSQPYASINIAQGDFFSGCKGSSISLPGTYNQVVWSNGATTNTVPVNTSGVYSVATQNACLLGRDTVVVNIIEPNITANASVASVCPGGSATLTGGGDGITYSWSNSISDGASFVPAATNTYQVTGTDIHGCSATASTSITVNPAATVSAIPSSTSVCAGSPATLTGGGTAVGFNWSNGIVTGVPFIPTATDTYYVTGTDANGCTATAFTSISIIPLPVINATATASSVCQGNPTALYAGGNITSYHWSDGITNGVAFIPTNSNIYTITATGNNGCTATTSVSITVNPTPAVTANASANILCFGNPTVLTGSGNAASYHWSNGVVNGVAFVPNTTRTYTVTGTNASGCTATANTSVVVNTLPTVIANTSSQSVCAGNATTLSGSGTATTYNWSNGITNSAAFVPNTTNTYSVTGTDANGCTATANTTITVNSLPSITLSSPSQNYCIFDAPVELSATPSLGTWTGSGLSGNYFNPNTAGIGSHTLEYSVTDANGCSAAESLTLSVNLCTDIETVESKNTFEVYPNPASHLITVKIDQSLTGSTYFVSDILGNKLMTGILGSEEDSIDISKLSSGIYFITVGAFSKNTVKLIKY